MGYLYPFLQGFQRIDRINYILILAVSKKSGQIVLLAFPEKLCSPADSPMFPEFEPYNCEVDEEVLSCSKLVKYLVPSTVLTTLLRPIIKDEVTTSVTQVTSNQIKSESLCLPREELP